MSDEAPKTIASMSVAERNALARELGVAGYHKRLAAEAQAERGTAEYPTPPVHAAIAAHEAARGVTESDLVDLASLDDRQRAAWIQRNGVGAYSRLLHQQLRGKTAILGRRGGGQ